MKPVFVAVLVLCTVSQLTIYASARNQPRKQGRHELVQEFERKLRSLKHSISLLENGTIAAFGEYKSEIIEYSKEILDAVEAGWERGKNFVTETVLVDLHEAVDEVVAALEDCLHDANRTFSDLYRKLAHLARKADTAFDSFVDATEIKIADWKSDIAADITKGWKAIKSRWHSFTDRHWRRKTHGKHGHHKPKARRNRN